MGSKYSRDLVILPSTLSFEVSAMKSIAACATSDEIGTLDSFRNRKEYFLKSETEKNENQPIVRLLAFRLPRAAFRKLSLLLIGVGSELGAVEII